ncbi:hypothetical protein PMAYCL1PPCAC_08644, partial [Pristionchus mayeri]
YSTNPYPIKKQFKFSLDSNNRKGLTQCVCVAKDKRTNAREYFDAPIVIMKTRILLTKVTGVRRNQLIDFTSPSLLSDAILIVEEKEVHVNKKYLSNVSSIFHAMFDPDSTGNRHVLIGVKYQ